MATDNLATVHKTYSAELVDVAPGSREVVACISAACVDRDREVVVPAGCRKKNYAGMTVFYDHDTTMPLASCQWVKSTGDKLLAKHRFTDKTELGREMFALVQDGVLRSYSIGFQPRERPSGPTGVELAAHPEWKGATNVYRDYELLEYSLVGVPANPEALQIAVAKGLIGERTRSLLGAAEETKAVGTVTLNHEGEAHARMLISQGKIDRGDAWSFDAAAGDAILGEHGGDWNSYGRCFLGEDYAAPLRTKEHWKYPVVRGGKVYVAGIRAAISRAAQEGDEPIRDAAQALLAAAKARKSAEDYRRLIVARLRAIYGQTDGRPQR